MKTAEVGHSPGTAIPAAQNATAAAAASFAPAAPPRYSPSERPLPGCRAAGTPAFDRADEKTIPLPERSLYLDLLRIAATFGVIILHAAASKWHYTPVDSLDWQIMNIWNSLVRWTVPVFIMISGVFHLLPNANGTSFGDEVKKIYKKIFRLACMLVFWSVSYAAIDILSGHFIKNDPVSFRGLMEVHGLIILGEPYYHLWFLYLIIGLYLVTPVFRCFTSNCKKEHIEYALILFFISGACIPLINGFLNRISILNGKTIHFSIAELSGYIGYYIAGYYFANYKIKNKTRAWIYALAVLSLLFTMAGTSILSICENKPVKELYEYLLPNTMFAAFAVFLLFQQFFSKIKIGESGMKLISRISRDTVGIYLIHLIFFKVFTLAGLTTLIVSPLISVPIIAIIVMCLSEMGVVIMSKIPILRKIAV